jgi:hypothetical protein
MYVKTKDRLSVAQGEAGMLQKTKALTSLKREC